MSARVHRCSNRAVPEVWTKFKTGSLFCKVGRRWKDISLNVSKTQEEGEVEPPAGTCACET